jgi:hypothetical protein
VTVPLCRLSKSSKISSTRSSSSKSTLSTCPLGTMSRLSAARWLISAPPASDADVLSEAQLLAISQSQPLALSPGETLRALEKLPDGAAAGASGWTFSAMKAIFMHDRASWLPSL